jgi:hypothetical protein
LNERVNFAVNQLNDVTKPGVQDIIDRLESQGGPLSPEDFVGHCLDLAGPIVVGDETHRGLLKYAALGGQLGFETEAEREVSADRVKQMLQLIVASIDFQFA